MTDQGEVYFEFTPMGGSVRVAAVCALTGLEVIVIGPASASQRDLEALALRKLIRQKAMRQERDR
jgi:hypothetical protein